MIERFIGFLKENNVYDSYKRNTLSYNDIEDCVDFDSLLREDLKDDIPAHFLSGSFIWIQTKEGGPFWMDVNKKRLLTI